MPKQPGLKTVFINFQINYKSNIQRILFYFMLFLVSINILK